MNRPAIRPEPAPPLTEQAFRRLRSDVLAGVLPAGHKLKVDELQRLYGFSSSPLREALSRLSQEGLVRADERRGFRVAPLSAADLADITRLRVLVDLEALADALQHGDDEWEAQVVAAFHRLEKVEEKLSSGPLQLSPEWGLLHRNFHLALLEACRSERLKEWSSSLFDQAERYRHVSSAFRQAPRNKTDDHRKILEAALSRNEAKACELWAEHVRHTERNVVAALQSQLHLGH